jgi:Zn-dependent protease
MQGTILTIIFFIILFYSIIIHEIFHGFIALWLGDATAKYAGRLTLNPISHVDPVGSILVPLIMYYSVGFVFGWAKPVPYNPYNLKNQKWGPALVALGGPASNISIAIVFAILARLVSIPGNLKIDIMKNFLDFSSIASVIQGSLGAILFEIFLIIITINVFLAFFNLIPIPPLDGSKLFFAILPIKIETMAILEQFGFVFLLFVIIILGGPISLFLNFMLGLFLGVTI